MEALSCERCGGNLRAQDGSLLLECPYCGYQTKLGADVLHQAAQYRAGVEQYAARAAEHAVVARAYANIAGGNFGNVEGAPAAVPGNQCRACGAPTRFSTGAMLSNCEYCGASLLAGADTQARGLDAAARAARAARLDALKSERHFAVGLAQTYRNLARVKRVLLVALPAAATLVAALSNQPDKDVMVLAGLGATGAGVLSLVALERWRRGHLARAEAAVRSVATNPDGHALHGTGAVAAWLNTHWWDEYRAYDLSFPYDSRAAAGTVHGLPILVIAAPLAMNDATFLEVLVSAWYDGSSERGDPPAAKGDPSLRRALQEQGFTVKAGPSGVHARLGDAPGRRLKEGLELGEIAELAARLAISQGGRGVHAA